MIKTTARHWKWGLLGIPLMVVVALLALLLVWGSAWAGFDEDGNLDAFFSNFNNGRLCLGDGTGSFSCTDIINGSGSTTGWRSISLDVGDVNGDSHVDAVVAGFGARNQVCLGDGAGALTCSDMNTETDNTQDVVLGDLNGDGDLDAILANDNAPKSEVCLNDGSGSFTDLAILQGVTSLGTVDELTLDGTIVVA